MEGRLLVTSGPEGTRFALELPGGVEEPAAAYTGSS